MHELALLGGPKSVEQKAPHYVWPPITKALRYAVLQQLDDSISIYDRSGVVRRLEEALERMHNCGHALLCNSGTTALYSMFVAAGIEAGDEVICPAYTFFASVTPLLFTGAWPVLADCGGDGNIDPEDVARRITPRTKAILATHMWGKPCELESLRLIAERHGLLLLEDASHAVGALYRGRPVGCAGDAGAISMQAQKPVPAGEGGAVMFQNPEMFYRALSLGHYNRRCKDEIPPTHPLAEFAVTGMGLKLRIHPLAAAIGLHQLGRLPAILEGREKVAQRMIRGLAGLPGFRIGAVPNHIQPSWYALILEYLPDELEGVSINRIFDALKAEGCVEIDRPGSTRPLSQLPLFQRPGDVFPTFRKMRGYRPEDFPIANGLHARSLKLPVWHDEADIGMADAYVTAIRKVARNYRELIQ